MKELIDACDSDVYDVLSYVAFAKDTLTRRSRAKDATPAIRQAFSDTKQQEFIDFVLSQYIKDGVYELSIENMADLLDLKYNGIRDAIGVLGRPAQIREVFTGFQKYLY